MSVRGDFFVTGDGDTCDSTALEMASLSPSSGKCQSMKNTHRRTCCDPNYDPIPIAQKEEDEIPGSNLPQGDEPHCDICKNGQFPGLPKTVRSMG